MVGHLLGHLEPSVFSQNSVIPVARKLWQEIFVSMPASMAHPPIILYTSRWAMGRFEISPPLPQAVRLRCCARNQGFWLRKSLFPFFSGCYSRAKDVDIDTSNHM